MRVLFACLLLAASTANACINIEGVTIDGRFTQVPSITQEDEHPNLQEILRAHPSSRIANLTNALNDEQTDAVRDIFSGNYGAAIEKLEAIESARPGYYSTAANLGTAYELAGDNRKALYWITEGIKRNERAHNGSEWLHKKILETRIALESDEDYLKKNHILPIIEAPKWSPEFKFEYDGKVYQAYDVARALHYQLGERMLFVKPTDPVVADLLYCLAVLEANSRVLEPAVEFLELAREYGYYDTADVDQKLAHYRQVIDSTWKISRKDLIGGVFWLVLLTFTLLMFAVIIRRGVKRSRARTPQDDNAIP